MVELWVNLVGYFDYGFVLFVGGEKEILRIEDERDLVMRFGIELNCDYSSYFVNFFLGDNKL